MKKGERKHNRLGEKRMMNCGQECEIIRYEKADDIDVVFPDGTLVCHRKYGDFIKGSIANPSITCRLADRKNRLGVRKQMFSGLWCIVHRYGRADDIDLIFDDGQIARNKRWKDFCNGKIAHPSVAPVYDRECRVGEERIMKNGMIARIIAYRRAKDIDVMFIEDGAIISGVKYPDFKTGKIAHPTKKTIYTMSLQEFAIGYYLEPLGFRKIEKYEWKNKGFGGYELDFYHDEKNFAIEVDGAIHNKEGAFEKDIDKNKKCVELGVTLYRLREPYVDVLNDENSINYVLDRSKRIKNNLMIDCKEELEDILKKHNIVIEENYIDFYRDIDKIFEKYQDLYINNRGQKHVGETLYYERIDLYVTIVAYHNCRKIDVEFSDGVLVYGVSYDRFKRKSVGHPIKSKKKKDSRVGEKIFFKAVKQYAKIICYRNAKDIDIEFDDGSIRRHVSYYKFVKGNIAHPNNVRNIGRKESV